MSGSCRHGLPCHTAGKAGALFSTRGVKKLSERLGSLQRTELPWMEMLDLTCLSAHWRDGYAPRDQTNHPVQLPGELAPLISLQTHEINHTGLDPKQDGHTTILISATHCVWGTWVQHWSSRVGPASPSRHPGSQRRAQETAQEMHRKATSSLHSLGCLFAVRRMWSKRVLDLKSWNFWVIGDLCKFIPRKSQTLPDITFDGCLLLIWIIKR